MKRKPEDIRMALDATLSGASRDPALYNRVVNASKGDSPPVKRKLTLSMALVLILVLMTGGVAVAATYRGVSWFLTERESKTINPDYLMNILEQHHDSEHLNIRVVDAYWDGAKLSMAISCAPKDPALTFSTYCYLDALEGSDHDCSNENADLLLDMGIDINITTDTEVARPYGASFNWVNEDDGSISMMITFVVNDMSKPISISLPIFTRLRSTGETEEAWLHCYLPVLPDPIAAHEHNWAAATCVSPKTCAICGRTEGGLGKHDFQPGPGKNQRTCPVCTYTYTIPE